MKSLKALFGLFVVVAGFYLAWKVIPPYFNNYQFEDAIESEARIQSYTNKSEDDIRKVILKKALELEIPVTEDQIVVQRMGVDLIISAKYTVHIDIPVYPFDLNFNPATKNRRI